MASGTGRLTTNFDHGVSAAKPQPGTTPYFNAFGQLSQDLARIGKTFGDQIDKIGVGRGQREGAEAAAASARGERPEFDWTILDRVLAPHRMEAAEAAYTAGVKTEIDAREKEIRAKFAFDPDGYKAESAKMVDGFIATAPGDWAQDVGGYARKQVREGEAAVVKARTERDQAENVATVTAREAATRADYLALLMDGKFLTPEAEAKRQEWASINRGKIANPLFKWSDAQAQIEEDKLDDEVLGVLTQRKAMDAYTRAGGGEPGRLAYLRSLEEDFGYRDPTQESRVAPRGSVAFQAPVEGRVTSGFGADRATDSHGGVDIAVPVGTPVKVAAPGVVVGVGEDAESGKYVRVRHADGTITSYAHLSGFDVQRGQTLEAGAVLGKSGNTGRSTGPHLHFKMRDASGRPVDPTKFYGKEIALAGGAAQEEAPVEGQAALAGLAPGRRRKLYNDSLAALRQVGEADRQEARIQAERDRDAKAERRDLVAGYQLDYLQGGTPDWRSDDRLSDADRVALEKAENAAEGRARAEARREAAAAKASYGATYDRHQRDAMNGQLDREALRDDVDAGLIPRSKAETLRALNGRALKNDIAIVKSGAPEWYHKRPPGMSDKLWKERKAQFDEGMMRWLPDNLDADDARKKQAGVNIGLAIYNPSAKVTGAGDGKTAIGDKAARIRALAAERQRTGMSDAEYQKRRREILGN